MFVKASSSSVDSPVYSRAFALNETGGGDQRIYPDLNDFEVMAERYLRDNLGIELQVGNRKHKS